MGPGSFQLSGSLSITHGLFLFAASWLQVCRHYIYVSGWNKLGKGKCAKQGVPTEESLFYQKNKGFSQSTSQETSILLTRTVL